MTFRSEALKWLVALASSASMMALISCASEQRTTTTAFVDIAYLDDSLAAVILVEATEKERFLGSPFIEKTTLLTYKLRFDRQGTIEPLAAPTRFIGAYVPKYFPWALGADLLLYDVSGSNGHLVHAGKAEEFRTDSCCVNWSESPWERTYLFKTMSAEFFRWNADTKEQAPLRADSVFGFQPEKWYDLTFLDGRWLGIYSDMGSYFLAEKFEGAGTDGIARHSIPGMEGSSKDTQILIYPGYEVILSGPFAPRSADFIRLSAVRQDSANTVWARFDRKRSFDERAVYEWDGKKVTFRSLETDSVLSEYDLSKYLKPQP